ncbi:MAG: histidine--tRNA ligase [bacterium]
MPGFRPPRGTNDFLPDDMSLREHVEGVIVDSFKSYGYRRIQTPTFEEFELLAARSGEEIREKMFTFMCDNTEYALRPEWSAPVSRLIASGRLAGLPKPYRLFYVGHCFRYERPQAGRYREFRQAGVELMGSPHPAADAEVMALAVRTVERIGLRDFRLKAGNIGIFRGILDARGYDYDFQSGLIGNIDDVMSVREKCEAIAAKAQLNDDDFRYVEGKLQDMYQIQDETGYEGEHEIIPQRRKATEEEARGWLERLPAVVEDTFRTMWLRRKNLPEDLAGLLLRISRVRGTSEEVMGEAEALVEEPAARESLVKLERALKQLEAYGIPGCQVVLGVARGLDFYTDTVFEIDFPGLGAQKQICGGGRYDRLVEEFGGPATPATGFAFGFDRLVEAYRLSGLEPPADRKAEIYVAAGADEYRVAAIELAEGLRRRLGKRVEVDVMRQDLKRQMGEAAAAGCDYVVLLMPDEMKRGEAIIRDMSAGEQRAVGLEKIYDELG